MIQVILTDEKGICWKFWVAKNMVLDEVMFNIRAQFYPEHLEIKTKQKHLVYGGTIWGKK